MRRAALALLTVVGAGCNGPLPEAESVRVTAVERNTVIVTAVVRNRGGDGEIVLELTLRDRAGGAVVGRKDVPVSLRGDERVTVSDSIVVAGTPDVTAEAVTRYPP